MRQEPGEGNRLSDLLPLAVIALAGAVLLMETQIHRKPDFFMGLVAGAVVVAMVAARSLAVRRDGDRRG